MASHKAGHCNWVNLSHSFRLDGYRNREYNGFSDYWSPNSTVEMGAFFHWIMMDMMVGFHSPDSYREDCDAYQRVG